jgi:hypothetical protein
MSDESDFLELTNYFLYGKGKEDCDEVYYDLVGDEPIRSKSIEYIISRFRDIFDQLYDRIREMVPEYAEGRYPKHIIELATNTIIEARALGLEVEIAKARAEYDQPPDTKLLRDLEESLDG